MAMSTLEEPLEKGYEASLVGEERSGVIPNDLFANVVEDDEVSADGYLDDGVLPKREVKMTAKSIDYQRSLLLADRSRMVKRLERKGTAINKLLSLGSITAIEEALAQYDDTVRIFQESHRKYTKFIPIEEKASDDLWFDTIDNEIFNTKHQAISVLRDLKLKQDNGSHYSRSSCKSKGSIASDGSKHSSKRSSYSRAKSSKSSKGSVKDQMLQEDLRMAELRTEANFLEEKYLASLQSANLKHRQEIAKSSARMKVLKQQENQAMISSAHQAVPDERILDPKDIKDESETAANSKNDLLYSTSQVNGLSTSKAKVSIASQVNDGTSPQITNEHLDMKYNFNKVNLDDNIENQSISPHQHHSEIENTDMVNWSPTKNSDKVSDMLYQLLKAQSAPEVDVEAFDGNPLNFTFFMMMFKEVVETKIDDQKGRLTRLLKYTTGEARETIKHCIQYKENGYDKAVKLLHKRYGDPHLILATYRKQIRDWPTIKFSDGKSFREFLNFIVKCESFICDDWNILDSPETICMLISKLPVPLVDRWNRKVMSFRQIQRKEPKLAELIKFVEQETLLVNDPLYSRDAVKQNSYKDKPPDKKQRNYKTLATRMEKEGSKQPVTKLQDCIYCGKGMHDFDDCIEFTKIPVEERSKFIGQRRLCYGCYSPISFTHNAKTCTNRRICKVCTKKHPTSLHGFQLKPKRKEEQVSESPANTESTSTPLKSFYTSYGHVLSMCIVPVKVYHPSSNKYVETMAMLDSCSQATFVADSLVTNLGLNGRKTTLSVTTINGTEMIKSTVIEGLSVSSSNGCDVSTKLKLPNSYTRDELPVDPEEVATKQKLKNWSHLQSILHQFPDKDEVKVELLIGANCLKALEPIEVIKSKDDGPYAYKTMLGWCVVGPISGHKRMDVKCSRIAVKDGCDQKVAKHHYEVLNTVKEQEIKDMLEKLYNNDFIEKKGIVSIVNNESLSEDENKFMKILEEGIKKKEGHYILPLPFREEPAFPNNRFIAERRLVYLKKKFTKDQQFLKDYKGFMDKLISERHAVKCTTLPPIGRTWYLPHHGVYNPKKPGKIRVVLDCGAEYCGKSLNSELLSGPDLTNQIVGILSRFRKERIGIMADIEAMYYQVLVPENQRSFLRFLWWDDGDFTKPAVDYEMRVHVFGATSSASCANYALRRTAVDNIKEFSKDIIETPKQNFYVDDMLKSKENVNESIVFIKEIKRLCQLGGFNLTKM